MKDDTSQPTPSGLPHPDSTKARELETSLAQFTGTTGYYRYPIGPMLLTDGVKYLADHASCYWLLDIIGSYQADLLTHPDLRLREMQFWTLSVKADHMAVVVCRADSDAPAVITQELTWTDFCLSEASIWVVYDGQHTVALLPSEY